MFRGACLWANRETATEMPIALKKCGTTINAVATADIEVGKLVIPVFSGEMLPCSLRQIQSVALARKLRARLAGQ